MIDICGTVHSVLKLVLADQYTAVCELDYKPEARVE